MNTDVVVGESLPQREWFGSAQFDRPEDHWPRQWAEAYVNVAAGQKRSWPRQMGHRLFPPRTPR